MTIDLSRIDWQAISAIFSILTALVGFWIALVVKKGQTQRENLNAFDNYRKELLEFTNHVIIAMDRVRSLIGNDPDKATADPGIARDAYFDRRNELLAEVSSLIDRGRFLFPNRDIGYGQHKGAANRGFRDPVLDRVFSAYRVLQAVDYRDFGKNREPINVHSLTAGRERCELDDRTRQLYGAFRHLSEVEQKTLKGNSLIRLDDMIVAAKRSFVHELFEIVQPQDWLEKVEKAHGIKLRSRTSL